MNKYIPTILLAIVCAVLAIGWHQSRQEVTTLEEKIAELEKAPMPGASDGKRSARAIDVRNGGTRPGAVADKGTRPGDEPGGEGDDPASRRMMSNLSKMLENPAMNKVMEASQRGALQALYGDLIESFGLSGDEEDYFMDLLMSRQMKQVDFGMKMMGGELTDEEKEAFGEEFKEISETVKTEMEKFLNDAGDFAEFEFYEKTMGERMVLSQLAGDLEATDAPLTGETHRALLEMMHDEKENFEFGTDLQDPEKVELSAERFSEEKIQQFSDDMDRLNGKIIGKAKDILSAEQLTVFEKSIHSAGEMQKAQMEMAGNMFRGGGNEE